ncbi:MAG: hypothetical protein EPO06_12110 [Burkholderiaceae bacterium]|nr:MAG: hypothetical protein EPO06_12110 [Burkholderiaceae bacterium]
MQRIAQRLTTAIASLASILAKLPALGTAGTASTDVITVQGIASGTAQAVSAASLPLPSGAATEATLAGVLTTTDFDTKVGSLTETAPATDTASSGVNGRLQRIAQRLTSIIALLPGSLGQKASAASLAVVVASDQSAIPVSDPSAAATTAVALTGSDQAISATAKDYRGFTIEETAGSTAKVVIYDDDDAATGTPLEIISLAANESRSEFYRSGIRASVGIYVDVVSGSVAGSVRVGP